MATYKLTPDTGEVSGTNSNMPLLVKPSVLEMGSLTSAEADSVRFYTDASLTTEIAREVVSADEIWVKVTSVTSSTEIWMDYDGVRSDYATSATYGAQNVWSDYEIVWHGGDLVSTTIGDSTANANTGNKTAANNPVETADFLGDAQDFNGTNSRVKTSSTSTIGATAQTMQCWANFDEVTRNQRVFSTGIGISGTGNDRFGNIFSLQILGSASGIRSIVSSVATIEISATTSVSTATDYLLHLTYDGANARTYLNASNAITDPCTVSLPNNQNIVLGANEFVSFAEFLNGRIGEFRSRNSTLSSDWITTEYNNQNDNAAFWVATEVTGGGAVFTPIVSMIS